MQISTGGSADVTLAATSVVVTGGFVLPYDVIVQPRATAAWNTNATVTAKTATSFTVNFSVAAPAGAAIDYFVIALAPEPAGRGGATLAGDIVNSVRDEIPDPVFEAVTDQPLPDTNGGLFRASTLYRWIDEAVRILSRLSGSVIEDWTAIPQTAAQPWYAVDPKFIDVKSGFSNQFPIDLTSFVEEAFIWPSTSRAAGQSLWGGYRKRSDHLEVALWPVPEATDPTTTLSANLAASGVDPIGLAATTDFLSFGYVQIDQEIIQYQTLAATSIATISRGVCGTTQAAHNAGAGVRHLGLWLKGNRAPGTVCAASSVVELPVDLTPVLTMYVMAKAARSQQEFGEAKSLMESFNRECAGIRADPMRKVAVGQIKAFGEPGIGSIYWPGGGGVIVP